MPSCPNFDCLDFSQSLCQKYPACEGCHKLYDCNTCSNQAALINGKALPCDMINLPEACRHCLKRAQTGFSQEDDCTSCSANRSSTGS